MHVCLLVTDILHNIFAIIYEDAEPTSRATLAALARTCKTFKEPALDILWKHLDGFKPLISCLPEDVTSTNVQGNLTVNRPLFTIEWRIVGQYAQRIRFLTIRSSALNAIDDRVIHTLMSAPPPTLLLPVLRSLEWFRWPRMFHPITAHLTWANYHIAEAVPMDTLFCPFCFVSFAQHSMSIHSDIQLSVLR
ncbi:hypothetical protein EDB19DRAFT_415224 [Suillus lakei]|nr:hypothetical protein EDB19DRAFT_415224 [Suillus lakei]